MELRPRVLPPPPKFLSVVIVFVFFPTDKERNALEPNRRPHHFHPSPESYHENYL